MPRGPALWISSNTNSESFDRLRTNGEGLEVIETIPFMLSLSKHVHLFRAACYRPLIYFTASVAATYPVIEPRMRPEPLG